MRSPLPPLQLLSYKLVWIRSVAEDNRPFSTSGSVILLVLSSSVDEDKKLYKHRNQHSTCISKTCKLLQVPMEPNGRGDSSTGYVKGQHATSRSFHLWRVSLDSCLFTSWVRK